MSTQSGKATDPAPDRFTPVYFRIQQRLRSAIESGELRPGDKLPSENALCSEFATTRSTVRHALSLLDYEGLIVREIGRGTFVAPPFAVTSKIDTGQCLSFEDQVAAGGSVVTYRDARLMRTKAPPEIVSRMALPRGALVYVLERVRLIGGAPVGFEQRYLPEALGKGVTREMIETRSVHDFLSEVVGETIPTINVSLFAEMADARVAKLLDIKAGSAIVARDHTYHDADGNMILCGRSTFRGDVRLEYTLGRAVRPASV